jgi:hypothetical protein
VGDFVEKEAVFVFSQLTKLCFHMCAEAQMPTCGFLHNIDFQEIVDHQCGGEYRPVSDSRLSVRDPLHP